MIDWLMHWLAAHYDPAILSWRALPGYLGAALIVTSFLVRTMIPLRAFSAGSNICIIVYAFLTREYPTLALNFVLLPLNVLRLIQMVKLVRRVRESAQGDRTMEWLKPYMRRRHCSGGRFVFRKGDVADTLFYIVSGSFRIPELNDNRSPGEFVGELGLLTASRLRTQSFECIAKGDLLAISYDQVHELFFQNPDFGFYFMQLASTRLFNVVRLMELELQKHNIQAELGR